MWQKFGAQIDSRIILALHKVAKHLNKWEIENAVFITDKFLQKWIASSRGRITLNVPELQSAIEEEMKKLEKKEAP